MNNVTAIIGQMKISERKDGRFEGRITINGKRKSFYGIKKCEVKNKAKDYLKKIENGYVEPEKIVFNDYIEYWLEKYKLNKIELSSYTRLYRVFDCQIRNSIGTMMIGDITTEVIQKFIDDHGNPTSNSIKPLALSGLKRIIHLLRPCLAMAVKEGIIQTNSCEDVLLPKESCIKVDTKKQFSLNDDEILEFREAALSRYPTTNEYRSRDGLVLLIILNLGLRVGEMLALRWSDINMKNGTVYINKTIQSNIIDLSDKSKVYDRLNDATKTSSGKRVLPLNDVVKYYLNELKMYDDRNNIKSEYIACSMSGTLKKARNLQRSLDRLCKMTNIQSHLTIHTLRHTFGSTLIRRGVSIEVTSALMGHANIAITYNKYIHAIQEEKAKAMTDIKIC